MSMYAPYRTNTLFIVAICIIQLIQMSRSQVRGCGTPYSCSNQTITLTDENLGSNGYKAAYGIKTVIQTAGLPIAQMESIFCRGIFSCAFVSLIHSQIDSGTTWCQALYSCAYVSQIITTNDLNCNGPQSCIHSVISAKVLIANGEQCCTQSVFTDASLIIATAPYTLYKSNISSSVDGLTMNLHGDHAGFGADVHCQDGHICSIICNARRSCEMLYVHGLGQITINTISVDTISPIVDQSDYDESKIDADIWTESSRFSLIEQQCNESPMYTYDNAAEHSKGADIVSDALAVCCRAGSSCEQTNIDINYVNNSAKVPIVCAGEDSCKTTSKIAIHLTNPQGPIYCEGRDACNYAEINTMDTVVCGFTACDASIINARTIHCISERSCANAVINSVDDLDLYLSGMESAWRASITCNAGDHCTVYCRGGQSCSSITTFDCIGTCTVYCDNDSGCPDGYTAQTPMPTAPTEATTTTLLPTQPPSTATSTPTSTPSTEPTTSRPSSTPIFILSSTSTIFDTTAPTDHPTKYPSNNPTLYPTKAPTTLPTVDPSKDPTKTSTKAPTNTPTSNPTPVNAITKNYEIKIDIYNCEVTHNNDCAIDPNNLNEIIESTLSIEENVEIISWAVVDEEFIIHLSVTTDPDNVLTPDVINKHIEAQVKENDDFGEVETEEKDDDFNDIALDDTDDIQNTKYLFNILTIVVSVCAFGVLCYCLYQSNALKTQTKVMRMMTPEKNANDSNSEDKEDIEDMHRHYDDIQDNHIETKGNTVGTKDYQDDANDNGSNAKHQNEMSMDIEDMYDAPDIGANDGAEGANDGAEGANIVDSTGTMKVTGNTKDEKVVDDMYRHHDDLLEVEGGTQRGPNCGETPAGSESKYDI